jgi:hypothetical protein
MAKTEGKWSEMFDELDEALRHLRIAYAIAREKGLGSKSKSLINRAIGDVLELMDNGVKEN